MNERFIDRYFWHTIITVVVIGVAANLYIWFVPRNSQARLELPPYPVEQVALGQAIYEATCAACHGADGAGYAAEGVPAPALNASEHAWHHTDSQR